MSRSFTRAGSIKACAIAALVVAPPHTIPANAGPLSGTDAANEFSAENAQCSAFYIVGLQCFGDRLDEKNKRDFENARSTATQRMYLMGKQAGMSDPALMARSELAVKDAIKDIDSSCVNISVLLNKYAEFCKKIMQNPERRVNELLTVGK